MKNKLILKRSLIIFFQIVIVLIGIVTFAFILWEPQLEGRNANAMLFEIYFKDLFLAYAYVASIPFFVALYQAFKLFGYVGKNKIFSLNSIKALRSMKYCTIVLSILIVIAGLYIRIFHAEGDDPAGFLAICTVITFISIVIAAVAVKLERILQNGIDAKTQINDRRTNRS